jgi:DNA-binding response OmpR family regulator
MTVSRASAPKARLRQVNVANAESPGTKSPASARKHRILLVDDEKAILTSLKRLLRNEPYEVVTASNAEEALRILEQAPAELIISDQLMPNKTGLELLREIRRRWPDTIRIILSGYTQVNTIIAAINEGAVYKFLAKPWNDEELKLHIRRAIEQHSLEKENCRMADEIIAQNRKLIELNKRLNQEATDANYGLSFAQELLESLDLGVIGVDDSGMIVWTNKRAAEFLGYEEGVLLGALARDVVPAPIHSALSRIEIMNNASVSGDAARATYCGIWIYGDRQLQYRVSPVRSAGENRGRVAAIWEEVQPTTGSPRMEPDSRCAKNLTQQP